MSDPRIGLVIRDYGETVHTGELLTWMKQQLAAGGWVLIRVRKSR